ncbi:zinc-ribbon domain-containing protein [Agrilactobacillus fermenti]|uniref:zinc ribbon domain-containing protein n=1 Tax=Agrilactobacillus fermenti TaxID=2586909 RepID=UPI001E49759D|nr:zinc ribbon domain-containing protein [Agrilactobacillus fermenti]MCD2256919.1 zinc-ribbon domain-containing protein [Agrilactobacillus fermenti]
MMIKICPNCGTQLAENTKFCTHCGQDVREVVPTTTSKPAAANQTVTKSEIHTQTDNSKVTVPPTPAPQPNANVEATKQYARNYWQFLLASLKHPFTIKTTYHRYFGFVSFMIAALLATLSIVTTLHSQSSEAFRAFMMQANLGFTFYLRIFIFTLLIYMAQFSVAYLSTHVLLGDRRFSYLQFTTRFAHYSNLNVFAMALLLLFSLMGISMTNLVLFILIGSVGSFFTSVAFAASIFSAQATNTLDKIYAYFLGSVILGIVVMIISSIVGASIIDTIIKAIENVINNSDWQRIFSNF